MGTAQSSSSSRSKTRLLEALSEHAMVEKIDTDAFYDKPCEKLVKDVAFAHALNDTGFLDYYKGSKPVDAPLLRIGPGFVDTAILFVVVPWYHTLAPGMKEDRNNGIVECETDEMEGVDGRVLGMRRIRNGQAKEIHHDVLRLFGQWRDTFRDRIRVDTEALVALCSDHGAAAELARELKELAKSPTPEKNQEAMEEVVGGLVEASGGGPIATELGIKLAKHVIGLVRWKFDPKDVQLQNGLPSLEETADGAMGLDEDATEKQVDAAAAKMESKPKARKHEVETGIDGGGDATYFDEMDAATLEELEEDRSQELQDRRQLLAIFHDASDDRLVIPNRKPDEEARAKERGEATMAYTQQVKLALPNVCMVDILECLNAGTFAKAGYYLHETDVTGDTAGTVRKWPSSTKPPADEPPALVDSLLAKDDFRMQKSTTEWVENTILKNDAQVSRHTTTYMTTSMHVRTGRQSVRDAYEGKVEGVNACSAKRRRFELRTRKKFYTKTINNLEKRKLRKRLGHNIFTTATLMFDRVAMGLDATTATGYTRFECTYYVTRPFLAPWENHHDLPTSAEAEAEIDTSIADVPSACVMHTPHALLWSNYCANIKHSLVVVDSLYDYALSICAVNGVTNTIACSEIKGWSKKYSYVLQRMGMGGVPTDIVTIHRARKYVKPARPNRAKRKSRGNGIRAPKRQRSMKEFVVATPPETTESEPTAAAEPEPTIVPDDDASSASSDDGAETRTGDFASMKEPGPAPSEAASEPEDETEAVQETSLMSYKPGWFAPTDDELKEGGCILTSERFYRMPIASSQVVDGDYLPPTRFHTDSLGKRFSPGEYTWPDPHDAALPEAERKGPWKPPVGWNGDGSAISPLVPGSEEEQEWRRRGWAIVPKTADRYADEELARRMLERSGMQPNSQMVVETWPNFPVAFANSKKISLCALTAVTKPLPINKLAVLRKDALAELPSETAAERVKRMLDSIAEASTERQPLLDARMREFALADGVDQLKQGRSDKGRCASYTTIPVGAFDVTALELVITKASGDTPLVRLHLQIDGIPKAFSSPCAFSDVVRSHRDALAPLLFTAGKAQGGNSFYMLADGRPIGSIEMPVEGAFMMAKLVIGAVDAGPLVLLPLRDATPMAQPAPMDVDRQPIETFVYDPKMSKFFKPIVSIDGIRFPGAVLSVLAVATETTIHNKATVWPMRLCLEGSGTTHFIFARDRVLKLKPDIKYAGDVLVVAKVQANDASCTVAHAGEWWSRILSYKQLPTLKCGAPSPPCGDIVDTHMVWNERKDRKNLVVRMADGLVYAFASAQSAKDPKRTSLRVEPGFTIDTRTWKTTPTTLA